MKTCTKCKETKPLTEFGKSGFANGKQRYRGKCKKCHTQQQSEYQRENREARSKYRKAYYQRHKESLKSDSRDWYANNQERAKEARKAWRDANPDKCSVAGSRRRARELNAPGYHTAEQWAARQDYHGRKCIYCGSEDNLSKEHLIPLSRGGSEWPANLAPSCMTCNNRKYTKTHKEFLNGCESRH